MYKQLTIFLEGIHDRMLFETKIFPIFEKYYDYVQPFEYGGDQYIGNCKEISDFISTIEKIDKDENFTHHYIFVTDKGSHPSVEDRKGKIQGHVSIDEDKIHVVVIEIEGWYLAGLNKTSLKKLGLKNHRDTDSLTKNAFVDQIPKKYKKSEIAFKRIILDHFSIEEAKKKNESFRLFYDNYLKELVGS